ncbi:MAG: asparagine synthase (glutamine-hydrolyzing) [Terriglobales bacterium]
MCGIAAMMCAEAPIAIHDRLQRMLQLQVHRGPDDGGIACIPVGNVTVGLGNRRLAILDLSPAGHQPMHNPNTGDILVYNGEIYNYRELRAELRAAGITFRGESDTEVLLRAYERWGRECLGRLRGMFAFALWDAARQCLLVVRDPLGIKPLYYAKLPGNGFVCASEIRSLQAARVTSDAVDRTALAGYLAYGTVQDPLTIYSDVRSLPAGCWLEVTPHGAASPPVRYWHRPLPDASRGGVPIEEIVTEGRSLLSKAVRRHLVSDVPVGIFLSSGLDSTAVLGLACREAETPVHSFSVSFPGQTSLNEGPMARRIATRLGAIHHDCPIDAGTALDWVEPALAAMDQPSFDGVNSYMVARAVRQQGIVVALSGQGGDEVFGGYRTFAGVPQGLRRIKYLQWMPATARVALMRIATFGRSRVFREKAVDIARQGADFTGLYFQYRRVHSNADLAALGCLQVVEREAWFQPHESQPGRCIIATDEVASISRLEQTYYLGNTLLRDGDVYGMANSLEIRLPLLDQDLVEWASCLPGSLLLPQPEPGKPLLRRACAEFFDQEQLEQPKRGFTPPLAQWLRGPLRELAEDRVITLQTAGLVERAGIDRVRSAYYAQPESAAWSRWWALVALGHWLQAQKDSAVINAVHA